MIKPDINCTGCGACYSACPQQAISMVPDEEGFLVPKIIAEKCLECGKCDAVCPLNHQNTERKPIAVYAAKHSNEETRLFSSSGGMFSALAEKIIAENGVVFGAKFDENMKVVHGFTETIEGLADFRGSKYVQSNIGNSYIDAKSFLDSGRQVLFTGTPCQIAGLKSFLQKDYENLLTVDLICHGVPSPLIWKKYLESVLEKYKYSVPDLKITKAFFREKKESWEQFNFAIHAFSSHLSREFEIISENFCKNTFMQFFLSNQCLRHTCYSCRFKSFKSGSDITIGDFWGIKNVMPDFFDRNGNSLVLLNSEKGHSFFNTITSIISNETIYETTLKHNPMTERSMEKPKERADFFKNLNFSCSIPIQPPLPLKIGILTLQGFNYGCVFQTYALMETLKSLGYKPILLSRKKVKSSKIQVSLQIKAYIKQLARKALFLKGDNQTYAWIKQVQKEHKKNRQTYKNLSQKFTPFIEKNISKNATYPLDSLEFDNNFFELKKQSKNLDVVIVGSDQVWRIRQTPSDIGENFCNFLKNSQTKRFAYAASFGTNDWEYTKEETYICSKLLREFIVVSVRESDGVNKCLKYFNRQAVHVLDPVFLLNKKSYTSRLLDDADTPKDLVFNYFLSDSTEKRNMSKFILKFFGKNESWISTSNFAQFQSPEVWLANFKNSVFVFTDSFHGCAFSIIFNKPFVVFMNNKNDPRILSVLNTFNLTNRLITSATELTEEKILAPIDWKKVNIILELEREKSLNFLRNSLAEIAPLNHATRPRYSLKRFIGKVFKRIFK